MKNKKFKRYLFLGVPIVLILIYYGILATDMYISETSFSLRSAEGGGSTEWLALFGQATGSTGADAYVVQKYIESPELLHELEKELKLKEHYQNDHADFLTRLGSDPSREKFLEYFKKRVSVNYDMASGILTLKVKAFTPEYAQQLCQAILYKSEDLVNRMRERSVEDSLALTRMEVARAEDRLTAARLKMQQFREKHDLLDPVIQAGSVQGLVAEFEGAAAKARAELAEARTYMQEDSTKIVALKARIKAIEEQIAAEKKRLTGKGQGAVNSLASEYEQLKIEHEFAQKQLLSAMTSLETARIKTESQSRYLVPFVQPTLPEEALWPRRGYAVVVSFIVIVLVYALGSLIVAAVREHAGV